VAVSDPLYVHAQPYDAQPSDAQPFDARLSDAQPASCQPQRPSPRLRKPCPCLLVPTSYDTLAQAQYAETRAADRPPGKVSERQAVYVFSPTHKRTEGRAPVWGSEFTSKRRRTTGGDPAETAVR
jgi:hypothetical protein